MITYRGGPIFDGVSLLEDHALCVAQGGITGLDRADRLEEKGELVDLAGDILAPGYVDLQVNGGGGVMFNDDPSLVTLTQIAAAHRGLGSAAILPTLITDRPDKSEAAIAAVEAAVAQNLTGIAGLHLEGPHLSKARKGAHDETLIRPMQPEDLALYCDAARRLPALLLTIAPENVSLQQVERLAKAGVVVSLGHSDCDYETACAYQRAGAVMVTHLFNAMSPLTSRAPGLVGAALNLPGLSAGLIADGVHVHPASMRAAMAAKAGSETIFLVSDAMAVAGSAQTRFTLNGREITRAKGRLTLADGTLAGADLDLTKALNVMINQLGCDPERALRMATSIPARCAGLAAPYGRLKVGEQPMLIRISPDWQACQMV